jgi:phosphonate transport system substrate-binding protein
MIWALLGAIALCGSALITAACTADSVADEMAADTASEFNGTLSFSGIPDQDASRWAQRYQVLADYLSDELDVEVRGIPAADYAAVVLAFRRGDIQLGWFGGLTGVQARLMVPGANAVAQRPADGQFHSVFIVGADVEAESLGDLASGTFTFGSESSTSGHLMPRHYLLQAGVDADTDFNGLPNFSGSHDTTWKLVESGAYHAGALNEAVWDRAVNDGAVDLTKVRELSRTPAYFDYNWTVRPDLDIEYGEGFIERLVAVLLTVDDPEVLELFSTDGFVPTTNENYEDILAIARSIGIVE